MDWTRSESSIGDTCMARMRILVALSVGCRISHPSLVSSQRGEGGGEKNRDLNWGGEEEEEDDDHDDHDDDHDDHHLHVCLVLLVLAPLISLCIPT